MTQDVNLPPVEHGDVTLVHLIDTSSVWWQLWDPQPRCEQLPISVSEPLQFTSSSQIRPVPPPYLLLKKSPTNLRTLKHFSFIANCITYPHFLLILVDIKRIYKFNPGPVKIRLYESLVILTLLYGAESWPISVTQMQKISSSSP